MINQNSVKFTVVFVCDSVKKSNYGNQVENNTNGNGVTRNEPDYRLNPPITFSPLSSSSLRVTVWNFTFKCLPPSSILSYGQCFPLAGWPFECMCVCVCGAHMGGSGIFKK